MTPLTEGTYRVEMRDRVTGRPVDGCDFGSAQIEGSFSRTLDGISEAEITETRSGDDCDGGCDCVVSERRHELAIIRNDWPEPAWVGPIVKVVDDSFAGTVTYQARDRLYWAEGAATVRPLVFDTETDIVTVFRGLLDLVDDYQPSLLDTGFRGVGTDAPPLGGLLIDFGVGEGESIYGEMASLAKSALDWTVVGPHLYWGSPSVPFSVGPTILPEHFQSNPIIDRDAGAVASQVVVLGTNGVRAAFPETDTDIGLGRRTLFVSDTNLNTVDEAAALARTVYEQNREPNTFIITGDGTASPLFPLPLHELIPGRLFPIVAQGQCLEAEEDLVQLFNVVVEFATAADPGRVLKELRVALDFRPPAAEGSPDRQSG